MITADPNTLRYGANRFAAAAQEMKRQAIQLEQTTSNARQGQDGWTGEGSQAFMMRGEGLVNDANKASQAFESVANTLSRFAMRMEHVLELRRRADRLDQQAFEYGDETLDSIHTRQHLRHQAAQLRHQADSEASVADSQASKEFQMIAQMVPATLIPGADANANQLEGLPKHWQDYYRRHPDLLKEEEGASPMTMGSYKRADYDQIKRRDDAMAALIEYHKLTQSPWLSDEDRKEAARVYCEQAYSKLTADELEQEINLILREEEKAQKWQDQIQSGVYGEELIVQEGYLGYAFKEYYKEGALAAGMAGVLAGMGKLKAPKVELNHLEDTVTSVPSVKNGEFTRWFNEMTPDQFDLVWADPKLRDAIKDRLRHPGGLHEWHLVARADTFKRWGVTVEQIAEMRTIISNVTFVNPPGKHGGKGSTKAHNELLSIIDSSTDYEMFKRRLQNWADYRFEGGSDALPEGLRR